MLPICEKCGQEYTTMRNDKHDCVTALEERRQSLLRQSSKELTDIDTKLSQLTRSSH